jgi:hypothetical protein
VAASVGEAVAVDRSRKGKASSVGVRFSTGSAVEAMKTMAARVGVESGGVVEHATRLSIRNIGKLRIMLKIIRA